MACGRLAGWMAIGLLMVAAAGCGRGRDMVEADRPLIVASIHPLTSLTAYLVDNFAQVETLLPPGASPHGFEMTARQMRLLSQADVLVVVGMNLDPWAERAAREIGKEGLQIYRFADLVAQGAAVPEKGHAAAHDHSHDHDHDHDPGQTPMDLRDEPRPSGSGSNGRYDQETPLRTLSHSLTVAARDQIKTPLDHSHDHDHDHGAAEQSDALPTIDHHGHDHSGPNPHLWLDPILVDRFVAQLAIRLGPTFEHVGQSLRMRANMFRHEIFKIDVDYRHQLARVPNRRLVTFHNAFDLLAARYDLEVVAHLTEIELAPGGEVTPRQLRQTIDAVQKYDLKVIYAEPQFPEQAMQAIRQQTGVRILRLDPLGHPDVPGVRNWVQMMRSNLDVLVQGQSLE